MLLKILILILLAVILFCLGSAAYYLVSQKDRGEKMAKALTWRIGLSLTVFILLMLAFLFGWIRPHDFFVTLP